MTEGRLLLQTLEPELKVVDELEALHGKTSDGFCECIGLSGLEVLDWMSKVTSLVL